VSGAAQERRAGLQLAIRDISESWQGFSETTEVLVDAGEKG